MTPVARQIRAVYDDQTIVVYQAYSPSIAAPAVAAQTFVAPFKVERMTWIKPSFLWMMYRCGWATKPGQERVLEVRIARAGFEWALEHAALSHFDAAVYPSHAAWEARRAASPVRVQWDPERDLSLRPLAHRSLQVGLSGAAVRRYVGDWIHSITDITDRVDEIHRTGTGLPDERPYPLPPAIGAIIGASAITDSAG